MQMTSRLFKDVEETPVRKAAWWVEFALRHITPDFKTCRFVKLKNNLNFKSKVSLAIQFCD